MLIANLNENDLNQRPLIISIFLYVEVDYSYNMRFQEFPAYMNPTSSKDAPL